MKIFSVVLSLVLFSFVGNSQELGYQVNGVYTKSIKQEKLLTAETMKDINPGYPSSWIAAEDYVSADLSITSEGVTIKAEGANEKLSQEQKSILNKADLGSNITVDVKYKAENAATSIIEIKTINFTVTIVPEVEATYGSGKEDLMKYFQEHVINLIPASASKKLKLATVQFLVDESGEVKEASIVKSSETPGLDELFLNAINNMPTWKPAENFQGEQVGQLFTFSVGNSLGC